MIEKKQVCAQCKKVVERVVEPVEKLWDEVETVNGCYYFGDKLNASGRYATVVTDRTKLGWIQLRLCVEFLYGKKFSLKIKGRSIGHV